MIDDADLVRRACKTLDPKRLSPTCEVGGVGCALVMDQGNSYVGVSVDTSSSMGFCAEHNAIGTMITVGESKIVSIVAVDWDEQILAPCRRCREFIFQIDPRNAQTRVLLRGNRVGTVRELLPEHWADIN